MGLAAWGRSLSQGSLRLLNQSPLPVAIDFGSASLKLLQVAQGEPPTLIAAGCLDVPDELMSDPDKRLSFELEALPKLVKACGLTGRRAVCAIPAAMTFCKHMQTAAGDAASIAAQVRSGVSAQIGLDESELVFRHMEVPVSKPRGGQAEVICMAVLRDLVERLMGGIKAAKLEPVGMHAEWTALTRAFDPVTRRESDRTIASLYLDIGSSTTKAVITCGRDIVFARTIELGGRHVDESLSRHHGVPLGEARAMRLAMRDLTQPAPEPAPAPALITVGADAGDGAASREGATTAPAEPAAAPAQPVVSRTGRPPLPELAEPLEILADEVAMCARYYESLFPDRRIGRTIFVGGESRHVALCQLVARTLRVPAQVADPMARIARTGKEPCVGVDLRSPHPGWAIAVGLCLCPTDL